MNIERRVNTDVDSVVDGMTSHATREIESTGNSRAYQLIPEEDHGENTEGVENFHPEEKLSARPEVDAEWSIGIDCVSATEDGARKDDTVEKKEQSELGATHERSASRLDEEGACGPEIESGLLDIRVGQM